MYLFLILFNKTRLVSRDVLWIWLFLGTGISLRQLFGLIFSEFVCFLTLAWVSDNCLVWNFLNLSGSWHWHESQTVVWSDGFWICLFLDTGMSLWQMFHLIFSESVCFLTLACVCFNDEYQVFFAKSCVNVCKFLLYKIYFVQIHQDRPVYGIKARSHVGFMFWDKGEDPERRTEVK